LSALTPTGVLATALGVVFAVPAVWLLLFASGLVGEAFDADDEIYTPATAPTNARARAQADDDDEEDEGGFVGFLALGALAHYWYIAQARVRRLFGIRHASPSFDQPYDFNEDEFGTLNEPVRAKVQAPSVGRIEPSLDGAARRSIVTPPMAHDDDDFDDEPLVRPAGILADDDDVPFSDREGFELPPLTYLAEPKKVPANTISTDALEQNARLLEGVLEDFGVKGEIIHVRPGPVVTLVRTGACAWHRSRRA
jgi:S-DNA-T family DNA segregation ATPase FtsK/SpoIIIE